MPFFYPANFQRWVNGTPIPKDFNNDVTFDIAENAAVEMFGMMDKDEYNLELKKMHFGKPTPLEFPGYNVPDAHFAFWSSDEIAYSSVILALTQCQYLFD